MMIDLSNYSCDKCAREFSRHCKHCYHTADKAPTRFKKKKKTGVQTPEYRRPTPPPKPPTSGSNAAKPNPNYVPPATVPLQKTMYGLNLYIPFEDLDAYIHEHIDKNYGDCHFIPVKVGINEVDLSVEIKLLSASSAEIDNNRYKLDLNALSKEN